MLKKQNVRIRAMTAGERFEVGGAEISCLCLHARMLWIGPIR